MTGSGSDVNDTEQTNNHIGMFYRKTTASGKTSISPPPFKELCEQTIRCSSSEKHGMLCTFITEHICGFGRKRSYYGLFMKYVS
jgi:hypothetical protein